ncbi:MAG: MYG1 family protein [Oscillospiraceae bacterium]
MPSAFNPVWDSKEDQDACFFKAVAVAKQILENQIASANAVNRADEKVQQAYQNSRDGIVVLPCYLPWKNGLYKTDALFVVSPQPARRLERPVRHRPQDQAPQAPSPELGRSAAGGH